MDELITAVSPAAWAAATCSRTLSRLPVSVGLLLRPERRPGAVGVQAQVQIGNGFQ